MNEDGKPKPDPDAPTLPGLSIPSPSPPQGIAAGTETPPPASSAFDRPTVVDGAPVGLTRGPASPLRGENLSGLQDFPPNFLLGERYQILRVLGQGGMGAVYQALDLELDRTIALKVIRPELAGNPGILQRFKQELILARHITHKNVIRIYDMGEAGGTKFITMEFVEGEDLRTLLRERGKFQADDAVEVVRQVSSALDAAHAGGVIHRDLKPQNIMRDRNGRIVVMDFGLARSFEAAGMTQTGALVGTLEYMSPEQALGAELDQRSDLFALGLIFFELLTGKVPYKADTAIASLMKRTQERAVPASEIDAEVPPALSAIVSKCLEREAKNRYGSAQEIFEQLQAWQRNPKSSVRAGAPSSQAPRSVQISLNLPNRRAGVWIASIAALVALFFALPAARRLLVRSSAPSGSPSASPQIEGVPDLGKGRYLAVLPLRVMGEEKNLRYVADGLVDAISAKMFPLQELQVASSSAVERAVGQERSLAKIAGALGVNLVLQGTLAGSGDKLRVTLDLEDVATPRRVWSKEFSGVPQDLLTLEDQIYASVVQALDLKPSNEEMARSGVHPTENTTAYDLYLKGRDALRGNQGVRDTQASVQLLEQALRQDPNFALAYTGLADANLRLYAETKDSLYADKALAAAQKAENLNAALPEVHLSLGSVYSATGRNAEAITELKRALALAPNSDDAYRRLGSAYRASGRKPEAIAAYQSAVAHNPYYWDNHNTLGGAYFEFGDNEKALDEYQRVSELAADNPIGYQNTGAVFFRLGRWNDSIPAFQKSLQLEPAASTYSDLGTAYFYLQRYDEAIKMFEKAVALSPKDETWEGNLADAYRAAGRTQEANGAYDTAIHLAFQQLQVNPKSATVTGDLALYYAKKGDSPHALQYIRQARTLDPSDLQLIYTQAQIYALSDKQKDALVTLREAFEKGYAVEEASNDPEMAKLKGLPEFADLLREYSKKSH